MTQEVKESLQVSFKIDPNADPTSTDVLLRQIANLGGVILDETMDRTLNGSELIPPELITKTQFKEWVEGLEPALVPGVAIKCWVDFLRISNEVSAQSGESERDSRPASHTVDINHVLSYIRGLEEGRMIKYRFGKTSWNLFARLINERRSFGERLILLPWVDVVHVELRSNSDEKRLAASRLIKQMYAEADQGTFEI